MSDDEIVSGDDPRCDCERSPCDRCTTGVAESNPEDICWIDCCGECRCL